MSMARMAIQRANRHTTGKSGYRCHLLSCQNRCKSGASRIAGKLQIARFFVTRHSPNGKDPRTGCSKSRPTRPQASQNRRRSIFHPPTPSCQDSLFSEWGTLKVLMRRERRVGNGASRRAWVGWVRKEGLFQLPVMAPHPVLWV